MKKFALLMLAALMIIAVSVYADPQKVVYITGFENSDENQAIATYNGPKSEVKTEVVTDIVHEGKYALKVTYKSMDWIGVLWTMTPKSGDWTNATNVSFWVYSDGTKTAFNPVVEDANLEQFMLPKAIPINWTGWNQVVIPIAQFRQRTDYQSKEAKLNKVIDYPVHTFHFLTNIGGTGTLYFDQLELQY